VPGGNRNKHGDPRSWLGRLVILGEDLWEQLLDLVEASMPSCGAELQEPTREVREEEEIVEIEEEAERYFGALDFSETASEEVEPSNWPDLWDEERIWGDISPEERRSLRKLLEGRASKWMDT
jgi:hypothetical protein